MTLDEVSDERYGRMVVDDSGAEEDCGGEGGNHDTT
jgi:hypothetical protein